MWRIRRDVDLRQRARRLPGDLAVRPLWRGSRVDVPHWYGAGSGRDEAAVRALREVLFAAAVGIAVGLALGWCYGLPGAL